MRKEIMVSDLEYCVMWVSCNFFVFCSENYICCFKVVWNEG